MITSPLTFHRSFLSFLNIILFKILFLSTTVFVHAVDCTFPANYDPKLGLPAGCQADGTVAFTNYTPKGMQEYITGTLNILFPIFGIVAVLFIVMSGSKMVMNSHNEQKAKEGQKGLTWAILGLLATILAYAVITGTIYWIYGLPTTAPTP
jgi:hypothetical protein